ncbi:phage replication protein [hydrothermal vent metagenome]|uniref:Phage replication protein n=1 Tax=hydrothermal vent metagenome TaxID=652676 RepID=A0A1W1BKA3_9ZZZZ
MKQQNKNRLKKAKSPFTTVYNELINDDELKLRDKGLYLFMLSKPNDWAFSVRGLAAQCIEGRDSIARSLNNLIKAGWLRRVETKINGKYKSYIYEIQYTKLQELSDISDSLSEKPNTEKQTISKDYNKKEREGDFYEKNKKGILLFIDESIKQQKEVKSITGYKKSLIHKFITEDAATIETYAQWTIKYSVNQLIREFQGKKYKCVVNNIEDLYILEDIEYNSFEFVPILRKYNSKNIAKLRMPFETFNEMKDYIVNKWVNDAN